MAKKVKIHTIETGAFEGYVVALDKVARRRIVDERRTLPRNIPALRALVEDDEVPLIRCVAADMKLKMLQRKSDARKKIVSKPKTTAVKSKTNDKNTGSTDGQQFFDDEIGGGGEGLGFGDDEIMGGGDCGI